MRPHRHHRCRTSVVADMERPQSLRELAQESSLEEAFVKIIGAAALETLA